MSNVIVKYSDFSRDKSVVDEIIFDLLPSTTLVLSQNNVKNNSEEDNEETVSNNLIIYMVDKSTDEVEISGELDIETINSLIRSLIIFRGQLSNENE